MSEILSVRRALSAALIALLMGVSPSVVADDGTRGTPPGAPTNVDVQTTSPFLTITWNDPAEGPQALGFNVYAVDPSGVIIYVGSTSALIYQELSASNPLSYYFVTAYNHDGEGPGGGGNANWPFRCDPVHVHVYNSTGPGPLEFKPHVHLMCLPV